VWRGEAVVYNGEDFEFEGQSRQLLVVPVLLVVLLLLVVQESVTSRILSAVRVSQGADRTKWDSSFRGDCFNLKL
jgi:hypothetical protein